MSKKNKDTKKPELEGEENKLGRNEEGSQESNEERDEEEGDEKQELTESALKGTHHEDFSLEKEQKAKEEECEREEGNCDESRQ